MSRHSESPRAICVRVSCLVIAVGFGRTVPASDAVGKAHGVFMLRGSGAGTYVSQLLPGVTDVNPALREWGIKEKKGLTPKRTGYRRVGRPPFGAELVVAGWGHHVLLLLGEQLEPQQLTDAVIYETWFFLECFGQVDRRSGQDALAGLGELRMCCEARCSPGPSETALLPSGGIKQTLEVRGGKRVHLLVQQPGCEPELSWIFKISIESHS